MAHRFDWEDAVAVASIERNARPAAYTTFEGAEWRPARGRRFDRRQPIHSLVFSDAREWDEHNGWRRG